MEAGIVGLPNVGKSTLFNALTRANILAANYPFATIEPNVGVVPVPEPRLEIIQSFIKTQKVIPALLRLVDIAGIVKGASQGEGLGNKFLSHIREVDAILQVVRCFTKAPGGEDIIHVSGTVDPIRDIEIINTELILADLETVDGTYTKSERAAKSGEKETIARWEALKKLKPHLESGKPARTCKIDDPEQQKAAKMLGLITAKKVLYVMNVDEEDLKGQSPMCQKVREHADKEGSEVVPVCAKIESELSQMSPAEQKEMLEALGMTEPALDAVAHAAYHLLGLQSYFTAGEKEVRAWTIHKGFTAPQAAGVIHTDFERGFIRAEIYSVPDLQKYKAEKAIKEAGKMRIEGKDYVMQDGDVCHFLFNV
ncbi:MAG: redox-regulated ATPase YchF [Planctomycetes bacterium]|nr:redox-regulated ATPase YchF [Planctomycetota bacterium]